MCYTLQISNEILYFTNSLNKLYKSKKIKIKRMHTVDHRPPLPVVANDGIGRLMTFTNDSRRKFRILNKSQSQ